MLRSEGGLRSSNESFSISRCLQSWHTKKIHKALLFATPICRTTSSFSFVKFGGLSHYGIPFGTKELMVFLQWPIMVTAWVEILTSSGWPITLFPSKSSSERIFLPNCSGKELFLLSYRWKSYPIFNQEHRDLFSGNTLVYKQEYNIQHPCCDKTPQKASFHGTK